MFPIVRLSNDVPGERRPPAVSRVAYGFAMPVRGCGVSAICSGRTVGRRSRLAHCGRHRLHHATGSQKDYDYETCGATGLGAVIGVGSVENGHRAVQYRGLDSWSAGWGQRLDPSPPPAGTV